MSYFGTKPYHVCKSIIWRHQRTPCIYLCCPCLIRLILDILSNGCKIDHPVYFRSPGVRISDRKMKDRIRALIHDNRGSWFPGKINCKAKEILKEKIICFVLIPLQIDQREAEECERILEK